MGAAGVGFSAEKSFKKGSVGVTVNEGVEVAVSEGTCVIAGKCLYVLRVLVIEKS
jgi:hypothetical protein